MQKDPEKTNRLFQGLFIEDKVDRLKLSHLFQ